MQFSPLFERHWRLLEMLLLSVVEGCYVRMEVHGNYLTAFHLALFDRWPLILTPNYRGSSWTAQPTFCSMVSKFHLLPLEIAVAVVWKYFMPQKGNGHLWHRQFVSYLILIRPFLSLPRPLRLFILRTTLNWQTIKSCPNLSLSQPSMSNHLPWPFVPKMVS